MTLEELLNQCCAEERTVTVYTGPSEYREFPCSPAGGVGWANYERAFRPKSRTTFGFFIDYFEKVVVDGELCYDRAEGLCKAPADGNFIAQVLL